MERADTVVPAEGAANTTNAPRSFPVLRKNEKCKKATKRHPGFIPNLGNYITEYTENTSLHGVRYLGEQKRNIFEKIWWLIVFVISLYLCVNLIVKTYNKWESNPVIISFAQSPTLVWQIPFPAVTVCPQVKIRQTVFNFTHFYHEYHKESNNVTAEEIRKFQEIALMCDSFSFSFFEGPFPETTNYSTIDFLAEVAPQFDEVLWVCRWANLNETCESLFTRVLTEEGVCYTFNMLDGDDIYTNVAFHNKGFLKHNWDRQGWTLESGYREDDDMNTFPRRAISSGQDAGLTLLLRAFKHDFDYLCRGSVQGFKLLLHHPGEVPRVKFQYFQTLPNQEIILTVKPDIMTTSESLRGYDPRRRKCYFANEWELLYYQNYTQQNCEVECLTNFTLKMCGCVAYHMPHDESTPICGIGKMLCVKIAQKEFSTTQVTRGKSSCDCLPACTSLTYNAEMSQAEFNWQALFLAFKANTSEFPGMQVTRVTIFFKEMEFIAATRNELYGLTDFLANCGGLMGLFIGFSFLSAIETIYFLTFRLWCNLRRHGRHFWSGSPNLINSDKYDYGK